MEPRGRKALKASSGHDSHQLTFLLPCDNRGKEGEGIGNTIRETNKQTLNQRSSTACHRNERCTFTVDQKSHDTFGVDKEFIRCEQQQRDNQWRPRSLTACNAVERWQWFASINITNQSVSMPQTSRTSLPYHRERKRYESLCVNAALSLSDTFVMEPFSLSSVR